MSILRVRVLQPRRIPSGRLPPACIASRPAVAAGPMPNGTAPPGAASASRDWTRPCAAFWCRSFRGRRISLISSLLLRGAAGGILGADAIMSTPAPQVLQEVQALGQASGAPAWTPRLTETETRAELVQVMQAYYNAVIAPHFDRVQASLEADRCLRVRALLTGGIDGLLRSLRPAMRWEPPVLHVDAYGGDRDLHLAGRGLLLVPSYFCWGLPVPIADPALPPVVVYSVLDGVPSCEQPLEPTAVSALAGVVGRSRAAILRAAAAGATTGELARAVGISASAATQHTSALRDAGLINSRRAANTVLHTLTPLGAALVQANPPARAR